MEVRGILEGGIGRREEEHLLVRLRDVVHELVERRNDAIGHHELLLGERPAVASLAPGRERLVVARVEHARIAEDAALHAAMHGLEDHVGCGKLHVRHPHVDELVVSVRERHGLIGVEDVVAEALELHGIRVLAVNDLVEVIHGRTSLSSALG